MNVRRVVARAFVRAATGAAVLAGVTTLVACGADDPAPAAEQTPTAAPTAPADARAQLAALAAAAKDRKLTAAYTLATAGRPDRTVAVTSATDGSWRVDIPQAALGGTVDISMAQTGEGIFQCALPSVDQPVQPACVRVAKPNGRIDPAVDPRVQHLFTDWREIFVDRDAPLAVSVTKPLPGVRGTCFSVETTTTSLRAPLDVGIYCYDADGTLTAARLGIGTLTLAAEPAPAPVTITLAGPVFEQEPLPMAAPPTPTSNPTPTASASPTG